MATNEASPQAPTTGSDQKASASSDATTATQSDALGLALSGGGVRAALFSLGVVIGLIETGCHRRVRCLASVSGGSILNAALAHASRLSSFSSLTQFERLASNLAASLATTGTFAFAWRTIFSALSYLVRAVANAIAPLVFGGAWGLAKLLEFLRDEFKLDLAQIDYSGLPWQLIGWVTLASLLVSLLLSRGLLQQTTFDSVLRSVAGLRVQPLYVKDWGKEGEGPEVMHVLVATDLLSGEPMYFSSNFIHCRPYGWSTPEKILTAAAVYSSAAFPGVFPPKRLRTSKLKFQNGDMPGPLPPVIKLADGGVYNNLGNDWFEVLNQQSQASPPLWPFGELKLEPKPSMIDVNNVIIVNAGAPSRSLHRLSFLSTLSRIMSVLYDNTVRPRVTSIRKEGLPLIDIAETPFRLADRLAESKDDVGCRAKASLKKLEGKTDEFWADFTRDTAGTPTKLSGAGRRAAARLMLHGYLSSVVLLHAKFGGNLPEQILGEAYFLKLVDKELPLETPVHEEAPTPAAQETEKPAAQGAAASTLLGAATRLMRAAFKAEEKNLAP